MSSRNGRVLMIVSIHRANRETYLPYPIIQWTVQRFSDMIPICTRLKNWVVPKGIGNSSKRISFSCVQGLGPVTWFSVGLSNLLTPNRANVFPQILLKWFRNQFHNDQTILMPCPYALHQPCRSQGLFIRKIWELRDVDTGGACRQSRKGEGLTHICSLLFLRKEYVRITCMTFPVKQSPALYI